MQRTERHSDGDWLVRTVTGQAASKTYRCPGCEQPIPVGTPHVVAWRADDPQAAQHALDRRHWHTRCWQLS